jgi:hypothetical protein
MKKKGLRYSKLRRSNLTNPPPPHQLSHADGNSITDLRRRKKERKKIFFKTTDMLSFFILAIIWMF